MRILIIVAYINRYRFGHEFDFVPPITGIHLAAITPAKHQVKVVHEQMEPINYDEDIDIVAITFFGGFEPAARKIALEFKRRGKMVVCGGPHATFAPDETLTFCDTVVIGEAETVWERVLDDAERGCLLRKYIGSTPDLKSLPTPRYDLLPNRFFVRKVVQATRGCPFSCSFCSVPTLNPGFRMRPVDDVLRDIEYNKFPLWWQRKLVWFWDDNLTIRRPYIRELLTRMIPLKKYWLTQASMDIAEDEELLDLMQASGCIGIFFGIESFSKDSLGNANKLQNRIEYYKKRIDALHKRGICVMAGFIAGFDCDTPETIVAMSDQLNAVGVDVPFISILTPFKGTVVYDNFAKEGRLINDRYWEYYNGFNVTFIPKQMTPDELLSAHRSLWRKVYSPISCFKRLVRGMCCLRPAAFALSLLINGFYSWKDIRGNYPIDMSLSHDK